MINFIEVGDIVQSNSVGLFFINSMWFHKPFKADEWLLYVMESPIASGGRGFNVGRMYTRGGELVVSLAQEGLIRRKMQPTSKL